MLIKKKSDEVAQFGIIIGRDLDSDDSFEFFCLDTETISFRTKFDRVGSEISQVIERINQLDRKETFELSNLDEKETKEQTAKEGEFSKLKAESENRTWIPEASTISTLIYCGKSKMSCIITTKRLIKEKKMSYQ